jgi:pimeloyl-ACP methyl ester carboxylesterase
MPNLMDVQAFPAGFRTEDIRTNDTTLHVRIGGQGPAALLLHAYGETGDMWVPLATELARDHTVVVPDLRGMGLSAHPESGYDKKTHGQDVAGVLDALGIEKADLVTHDIGNMVGYAFAAQYPGRVVRFVLMDAPLPGIGPWDDILKSPLLWHFRFCGPDMERLVAGRERIYLDRFWNEFSADPKSFSEASREHYAGLYAQPGAMRAGFRQFAAFDQDVIDNRVFVSQGRYPHGESPAMNGYGRIDRSRADSRQPRRERCDTVPLWKPTLCLTLRSRRDPLGSPPSFRRSPLPFSRSWPCFMPTARISTTAS